ncbi:hypothetical protein HY212_04845 [Candidatus Pacearchaeota archaeon]|nr:hypothetical protein [Candidatus Pacearchaeota archaeon]
MKVYDYGGTYHCVINEKSEELQNLGLPPALKISSLESKLQDGFTGADAGKSFVLKRSDELHSPELVIQYYPPGSDYGNSLKVTATISLYKYGDLKQSRQVTIGNLKIEVGNTDDLT